MYRQVICNVIASRFKLNLLNSYMQFRFWPYYFVLFATLTTSYSCEQGKKKTPVASKPTDSTNFHYDLANPTKVKLPHALDEISGIVYYPKDTSVFAIIDEGGTFFKVHLHGETTVKTWQFDKKHDYEDLVRLDSTFFILVSNGDIDALKFYGDSIAHQKYKADEGGKKANEFETLYYDDEQKKIILICKDCEDDKKSAVTALGFDPYSGSYTGPVFTIDVKAVDQKLNKEKIQFKPSAAAINPVTNELYIISSVNKLLIITDRSGHFKDAYEIDTNLFNQPEGIAFTPDGDMLISNELGEKENATILIFKYRK